MNQKGVVRQIVLNAAGIMLLLGIIPTSGFDKQAEALAPIDTPTNTATPTSQPGVPLLISPADGDLLPQPVSPNFWKFEWSARTGPCRQILDISGPEGRHLHFETPNLSYQYQTNQYIPETALEPWYWRVTVQCPLGYAISEKREFHVMNIPRTPPPPSFTPTYTKTVSPSITPTFTVTLTPTPKEICLAPPTAPTPVYPRNRSILSTVKITFDWTNSPCAKSYWLLVWIGLTTHNIPRAISLPELINSRKTINVPLWNHKYLWRVAACNEHGCTWSRWNGFTIGRHGG